MEQLRSIIERYQYEITEYIQTKVDVTTNRNPVTQSEDRIRLLTAYGNVFMMQNKKFVNTFGALFMKSEMPKIKLEKPQVVEKAVSAMKDPDDISHLTFNL